MDIADINLCDLFNICGSDKDNKGYAQFYHVFFHKMRDDIIDILEIGTGGSLKAWRDFFINARIVGIDIKEDTQFLDEPRIETYICDSTTSEEVTNLMKKLDGIKFDIIIDDGSQHDMDQVITLRNLYPHLKDDGIYIIENVGPDSKISNCPSLVGCMCNHDPYFFVGLKNNMCMIYKHHLNTKSKNH